MSEKTVMAIDPGSSKCGLAVVRRDLQGKLTEGGECVMWRWAYGAPFLQ